MPTQNHLTAGVFPHQRLCIPSHAKCNDNHATRTTRYSPADAMLSNSTNACKRRVKGRKSIAINIYTYLMFYVH